MEFLIELFTADSVAHTVLIFGLVIALGLALGSLSFRGVRLGVAGVLFAGLVFGHYKVTVNHALLDFTREFGLILFVYTIGMQVGPAFFSALKKDGLRLNLLAAFVVLAGAAIAVLFFYFGQVPLPAAAGLFSGATTNTPSLGAVQQALKEIGNMTPEEIKMPGLGYAVAYPFGIVGIILTMLLIRIIFRIKPQEEARRYADAHSKDHPALQVMDIHVDNANLNGLCIRQIPALADAGVVISRVLHEGRVETALPETRIYAGDVVRAVGAADKLEQVRLIIGSVCSMDMRGTKGSTTARRVVVTKSGLVGKTIAELDARHHYGVTITRVARGDVEFPVTPWLEIQLADMLMVVGDETAVRKFAEEMGNAPRSLDHPQLIPVFLGIALGIILGSWPVHIPGIPAPVKLGLAGGPLLASIILSRIGRLGKLIWYMPPAANFMLREVGIALFLACVGLKAGDEFIHTLVQGSGLYWMGAGAVITFVPLFLAGLFGMIFLRMNYLALSGLLAGSMTDPPALAFASQMAPSNAQVVTYAAVYPLVMILRVMAAQLIVLFCA